MISAEQREARKKFLGSSDAAAVLGIDKYRSRHDVFLEKTAPLEDWNGNAATDAGTRLEGVVLDWAEQELQKALTRDQFLHGRTDCRAANLDAVILDDRHIVEAKTTGITGPRDEDYGEPGTDEVPERVIVQCHHQMAVAGPEYRLVWVPVLLGGVGFRMFRVDRNDELIEAIVDQERKFWNDHVVARVAPSHSVPSIEILKRIRRTPGTWAEVSTDLADVYLSDNEEAAMWEKRAKASKAEFIAAMGTADGARIADGREFTYLEQTRKESISKESTFRVLRFKGKKK